jgi:general secretion pathway protein A
MRNSRSNRISAVIVDEAHALSPAVLEEIRLLGNFDYSDRKLLQILLLGQHELNAVLNREDLRQLKQRVAVRLTLQPLSPGEVGGYLAFRWAKAGAASPLPFSVEAVDAVSRISKGIPRVINAICDNALVLAFAEERHSVTLQHVRAAAADLDLADPSARPVAPPPPPVEPSPSPVTPLPVPQLLRQPGPAERPSLLSRWVGKLGLAQ